MSATRSIPFGNRLGFGNGASRGEYFFSQGMQRSLFGVMTGYNIFKLKDSDQLSGMGNIKGFADANGVQFAVDDTGRIFKEATPGVGDFAQDRNPGAGYAGQGLIGDQKGRLLYFAATAIGMRDTAGVYTDSWKTGLTDYAHPADTYEGMTVFGNKNTVGILDSADAMNLNAFDVPSSVNIDCVSSGKNGVLLGANLGTRGILMLWNTLTTRSLAPWIWTSGKVQSIARTDDGWIVVTQKAILWTNGYSAKPLFELLDDPLGFGNWTVAANGSLVISRKLFVLNQGNGYARLRSGVYIFDLVTGTFDFVPVSTQNVASAVPLAIFAAKASAGIQEIFVGYRDSFLGKNYIGSLIQAGGQIAQYYSEIISAGSKTKPAVGVVLNLGLGTVLSSVQNLSMNIAVKLYNFERPLWGVNVTTAELTTTTLQVNGTTAGLTRASVGDEITVLEGLNAGLSRHVTAITNAGQLNETWTLDAALPNATETNVHISVQPFVLLERKTITSPADLPEMYFNARGRSKGKRFLAKVVIDSANAQVELHPSEFLCEDIGHTQ
ncbi:MAG TPA: hypothetical protein VGF48_10330 [Thermoanaerobaculia bacterium]|jgi:hypothetical protein